jgi:hypothetical protein
VRYRDPGELFAEARHEAEERSIGAVIHVCGRGPARRSRVLSDGVGDALGRVGNGASAALASGPAGKNAVSAAAIAGG